MSRFKKKLPYSLLVTVLCVVLLSYSSIGGTAEESEDPCTFMELDDAALLKEYEDFVNAPRAYISPDLTIASDGAPGSEFSLLPHLNYVAAQRDQAWCGNCWAWTGTGILGIALDVQEGIFDRLSVQYITSCDTSSWACCGGGLSHFATWYSTHDPIPWSNTNAHWQDGTRTCGMGSSSVACGTISTTPSYDLSKCIYEAIDTWGEGQTTAINNIKNVLHQNKAIYLSYCLNGYQWDDFINDFWDDEPEGTIWDPDYVCGTNYVNGPVYNRGCHAVLVVGYNDVDPDNPYWIVLNSWGTSPGGSSTRPNGLFRLKMDLNYDCQMVGLARDYVFFFQTLDVSWDIEPGGVPESTIPTTLLTSLGTIVLLIVATLAMGSKKLRKQDRP